jgi:exosome complex component RRP42
VIVLSDCGNAYDAMFMAARAALWDTKVPRTRSVEYKVAARSFGDKEKVGDGHMDVDTEPPSGFDTRQYTNKTTDFELPDYWDEGDTLDGRDKWPVCITLNLVCDLSVLALLSHQQGSLATTDTLFGCYSSRRVIYTASTSSDILFRISAIA